MTSDRLRLAASRLREVAEAATPGSWAHCYTASNRHWVEGPGAYNGYDDTVATGTAPSDATYIATMAPPVALALAGWLDDYAGMLRVFGDKDRTRDNTPALRLADAILDGDR